MADSLGNNEYTVYCHESPSGKRYVGITCQDVKKRWRDGKGYANNHHFTNAINKYSWDNFEHYILFENLTLKDAQCKERELIALWDLTNEKKGYNVSSGGWGKSGCHLSEETKKKIGESNKGKKISKEQRERLSERTKGKPSPRKGVKLTEEQKHQMSLRLKGKPLSPEKYQKLLNALAKPVLQFDFNGKFIKEYISIIDAERQTGVSNVNISRCCLGKVYSANSYIWIYKESYSLNLLLERLITIREINNISKEVEQYTIDDIYVTTFPSIRKAAKFVGIAPVNIKKVCDGKRNKAGGYKWKFKLLCDIDELIENEVSEYGFNSQSAH